jgi:D-xylose transport system permease protein
VIAPLRTPSAPALARALHDAELSPRTLSLICALAVTWLGLDVATDGLFLTPRNLTNLAVQTSAVGIMACGMVLVIVARHIDLSVGSILGVTGMVIATLQVEAGATWPLAVGAGLALGAAIGIWQGAWVAYAGLPAFVVTLAGLLIFRGAAWLVTDGRTVAPLDPHYQVLGGGLQGSIGAAWTWGLAALGVALLAGRLVAGRRRRAAFAVPPRPAWSDALRLAAGATALLGLAAVCNAATLPRSEVARGLPVPVLLLAGVALAVSFLAGATRFGRYVFAIGGSPEAALRAGVAVRRVTVGVFALMGALAAVAAVLTTARLGAGTNSMGTLSELAVIAAAVLGGTSLAGGVGSVGGAVLGALLMQSLENGMVLLGVTSALRQVAIGLVLIAAVALDQRLRGRR